MAIPHCWTSFMCIIMLSLSFTAGMPGVRRGLPSMDEPELSLNPANNHPRVGSVTDAGQGLEVNDVQAFLSGQQDGCDFKNDAQCQDSEDIYQILRDDVFQDNLYQELVAGLKQFLATTSWHRNQIELKSMTKQARSHWNPPSKLQLSTKFQTPGNSGVNHDGSKILGFEDIATNERKWDRKEAFDPECNLLFLDPESAGRCQEQSRGVKTLNRDVITRHVDRMPKDFAYFTRVSTTDRPVGDVQPESAHIAHKRWRYLSNPVSVWERKVKAEYHRRQKLVKLIRDLMSHHMSNY